LKTPLSELCLESIDVISGLAPRNTRLRPGANCFRTGDGDAACAPASTESMAWLKACPTTRGRFRRAVGWALAFLILAGSCGVRGA